MWGIRISRRAPGFVCCPRRTTITLEPLQPLHAATAGPAGDRPGQEHAPPLHLGEGARHLAVDDGTAVADNGRTVERAFVRAFWGEYVVLNGGGGLAASISAAAAADIYVRHRRRARLSISMGDPQSNRASPLFYSSSPYRSPAAESSSTECSTESQ